MMIKLLPLITFFIVLATVNSYAQTGKRLTYLIVSIESEYDKVAEKSYFRIVGEANNPKAAFVNNLIDYNPKLKIISTTATYTQRTDTTRSLFNYFQSLSEALEFLDEQGWQLFSINNDIRSIGIDNRVITETKYFFRQEKN